MFCIWCHLKSAEFLVGDWYIMRRAKCLCLKITLHLLYAVSSSASGWYQERSCTVISTVNRKYAGERENNGMHFSREKISKTTSMISELWILSAFNKECNFINSSEVSALTEKGQSPISGRWDQLHTQAFPKILLYENNPNRTMTSSIVCTNPNNVWHLETVKHAVIPPWL